jgi:hypothetical protein
MPKNIYCSKCGVELKYYRQAIPGKGLIIDLVDPHNCEGYAVESKFNDRPTAMDIIKETKNKYFEQIKENGEKGDLLRSERGLPTNQEPGDKRQNIVSSTAPRVLQRAIMEDHEL